MKSDNKHISVHHIGARSGSRAFPILNRFEKDIINVLYDMDPDCLRQIRERNQNLKSELHVLPYCLGDTCKKTYVNINYDPYTSSLYELNPNYNEYYEFNCDHDYLLSEACRTMEKRPVELVTIDHIFQSKGTGMPPPDFLSIDTEGSEYEILLGARETLKSDIVAVVLEAEFHPFRKGRKLFGDQVKLLSDQGFEFARFLNIQEASPFRAPIGLRAEGFHAASDVLFLRRPDNIDVERNKLKNYLMLRKLAFIAIAFSQFEYGIECLRRSKDLIGHHRPDRQEEPVYMRFLRELEQHIERMPQIFPPTFATKYPSFAASKSRFENSTTNKMRNPTGTAHRIKQLLRQISVLYPLLKRIKCIFDKLFSKVVFSIKLMLTRKTGIEALLIQYGLKAHANILRRNRIIQTQFLKK
ncbi:MAG: FkbM family methyltransferase [Candidatus Omnitrophota bacterium]|nr:MAG: FkbM family methyltransferase [Candidatus Omnitrophota bacterium]